MLLNHLPEFGTQLETAHAEALDSSGASRALRFFNRYLDNRPTPVYGLPGLARSLDLGAIYVKDEAHRLGLGSFKALGGCYAVVQLVLESVSKRLGRNFDLDDLKAPEIALAASQMTFACATAGNHGRSVAHGAKLMGARSRIFVHEGVSDERIAAIAALGGNVIKRQGSYDDAVQEVARLSAQNHWTLVSDTSWPGYERIPLLIMQGYTVVIGEALSHLQAPPTHIFVQAGVGGLAASIAAHVTLALEYAKPTIVVVEPQGCACVYASAACGKVTKIGRGGPSVMTMLECYEPSLTAWRILSRTANAFMTIEDSSALEAMNRLARPIAKDPVIIAGESGCAGLAGLLGACGDNGARSALKLDSRSRVLVINTEGATDLSRFQKYTGLNPRMIM